MDRKRNKATRRNIIHTAMQAKSEARKFFLISHYEHMAEFLLAHAYLRSLLNERRS